MTEVTVISPNIVELVGTLQKQFGAPRTENPLPLPPVQTASGDAAGNRSGRRAGGDTPPASSALRRSQVSERQPEQLSRPPLFQPERRPTNRPSTPFLTQLIGQQSAGVSVANNAASARRQEAGIAAYQRANGGPARSPSGIVFLSRRVDAIA